MVLVQLPLVALSKATGSDAAGAALAHAALIAVLHEARLVHGDHVPRALLVAEVYARPPPLLGGLHEVRLVGGHEEGRAGGQLRQVVLRQSDLRAVELHG